MTEPAFVVDLWEAMAAARHGHIFKHRNLTTAATEQKLSLGMHQMWQAQKKAVLVNLSQDKAFKEAELDPTDSAANYDQAIANASESFHATFASALDPAFVGGMHATLADMEDPANLPPQFQLPNDAATVYSKEHAAALVSQVNETTRSQLNDLLTKARSNGDSYTKTAGDIQSMFDGFGGSRAQTVAVTESAFAYENGSKHAINTLKGYGLEYDKKWLPTSDPCPNICGPNVDQDWIPTDDSFSSGDETPPGHPNCRCTAIYQRVEPKLSPEEHDAVDRYLGDEGENLEAKMRSGYPLSSAEEAHIRDLNSALSKSKLPSNVRGERLVSGLSCDTLKGKSILDKAFGLLHIGHLLESESNIIELLLSEAPSDADIFSAINAGAHSIPMFQAHLGISDADLVSSGLRAKLRKLAKTGKLTAWGKGGAVHYTMPGAPAPVHGAVVKKGEIDVPAGSNGIKQGDKVILPHGTTYTPTSCGQDSVNFKANVPEVKSMPAPGSHVGASGKSLQDLEDLFLDPETDMVDKQLAQDMVSAGAANPLEYKDFFGEDAPPKVLDDWFKQDKAAVPQSGEIWQHSKSGEKYEIIGMGPEGDWLLQMVGGKGTTEYASDLFAGNFTKVSSYKPTPPPAPSKVVHSTGPSVTMPTADELSTFTKISGPLGSQGGQWYQNPTNGEKWFVKPVKSAEHGYNELAANLAYRVAGADVAPLGRMGTLGQPQLITREIPGLKKMGDSDSLSIFAQKEVEIARQMFGVDAVLGNWDVVGLERDNMLWDPINKRIVRLDTGGAMAFRAQGATKPNWNPTGDWTDWKSLRNPEINPAAAKVFGGMTDQQVADALKLAKERLNILDLAKVWKQAGIPDEIIARNTRVIQSRLDQIDDIVKKLITPEVPVGPSEWKLNNTTAWKNSVTPSEREAIERYTNQYYVPINEHVAGVSVSTNSAVLRSIKYLDQVMARTTTAEAMDLKRGFTPEPRSSMKRSGISAEQWFALKPGNTFHDNAYSSASAGHGFPGSVRLFIKAPKGTHGIRAHVFSSHSSENEVLLARGTRYRVLAARPKIDSYTGKTTSIELDVEIIPPKVAP